MKRGQPVRRLTVVGSVLAASMLVSGAPSRAQVPLPGDQEAVVTVHVGDLRVDPTTIGPLAGADFGLFRERPGDGTIGDDGFTTAVPDYSCTSDADGDCSFVVPFGPGGETAGVRLWLAALAGPDGYYASRFWQTEAGGRHSYRLLWPTPELQPGETYRSGEDWVSEPGLTAISGSPEAGRETRGYSRALASGGVVGLSRSNPPLVDQCGLEVALVADMSGSMQDSTDALKDAMDAFVDALQGTPSQVALFTFGTDSPAQGFPPNTGLQSVATVADAESVKAQYNAWGRPIGLTNWDRALADVAGSNDVFDLVVVVTDGSPTVYSTNPVEGEGVTRFRELENARASANLVKSQGSRVIAVGVGDGVASAGAAYNLQTISGLDRYHSAADNIVVADYIQTDDFATLEAPLHGLALAGCAPSISVVKQIVPEDGTIDDAYTPDQPWEFAASSQTPSATIAPPAAMTDPSTGAVSFDVTLDGDKAGRFTITETQQPGYALYPVVQDGASQNASCIDKGIDSAPPVAVTDEGTGFTVEVGPGSIISCVVYNQERPVVPASVVVHKRWRVTTGTDTQDFLNGDQPSSLAARLSLTGPGSAGATEQEWGEVRSGYDSLADTSITLSEDVAVTTPPECQLTEATLEAGAPGASSPASGTDLSTTPSATVPLSEGTNEWTVTNVVTCHEYLPLTAISLLKVDQPGGAPLAGAVFQLYRAADGTEQPGDEPGAADEPVGPECATATSGTCAVGQLTYGDYYWYEVAPPAGYDLPTDRTGPLVTINAANAGTTIPAYQFTNPRVPGAAEVLKVDEVDRSILAGGTFELYADDGDGVYGDGDTLVGQCTTNAGGTCRLEDFGVGTYFWVETSPPVGYGLPADPVSDAVVISDDNLADVQQVTFADPRTVAPSPDRQPGYQGVTHRTGGPSWLPRTGGLSWWLLPVAVLMVTGGTALLVTRRRRSV